MIPKLTRRAAIHLSIWTVTVLALLFTSPAQADPVSSTPYQTFAGQINFQMTGASLRTQPNTVNRCSVVGENTVTQARLILPGDATIIKAYLYWAGSGGSANIDSSVQFEGQTITIGDSNLDDSRLFTERFVFGGDNHDFFSGFADITGLDLINAGDNIYNFSGLRVVTGGHYCDSGTVLGGWSLIVVYGSDSEQLRVINHYHGFQRFQHSQITLTPSNFRVPANGCVAQEDCKWGVLTWEGDPNLPSSRYPTPEVLSVNGTPMDTNENPLRNQFNSSLRLLNTTPDPPGSPIHGVDVDVYQLPNSLSGRQNATTFYQSGQDLVLLSAEIFSVRNEPVADLSISKSHSGDFYIGKEAAYTIRVTNNGPSRATGTVTVTDTLPPGLTYASGSDATWSCSVTGQIVTCDATSVDLAENASLPDITLKVNVTRDAASTVTNRASVASAQFDYDMDNNDADDATNVVDWNPPAGTKLLYFYMARSSQSMPNPNTLQRVVNPFNSNSGDIAVGASYSAQLHPSFQRDFTLQAGNIPIALLLRSIGDTNTRSDITATLEYSNDGSTWTTIGSQKRNNILGGSTPWHYTIFDINLGSNPTIIPGGSLRLTITNGPGSSGAIRSRTVISTSYINERAMIALGTPTVINVDSVAAHTDVAYPDGVVQTSFIPGATIRIRATVSDPFGHNDIESAFIMLNDASGSPVVSNDNMIEIATPISVPPITPTPPGIKIYEYQYTIPATGPNGTWTAQVTANEGTEGTISHQGTGTFMVGMPNIVISKTVSTIYSPAEGTSDPHAIPGATIQYDIVVTNTGIGPADPDSIIITDALPDKLRLVLNNPVIPVVFIDGSLYGQSDSGLIFDMTDVGDASGPFNAVALSNTGGTTPTPFLPLGVLEANQDSEGVDTLEDKINYIRINPKGTFAGSTGGADPSCTFQFRLKLQ